MDIPDVQLDMEIEIIGREMMGQRMERQEIKRNMTAKDLKRAMILLLLMASSFIGCSCNPVGPSYKDPMSYTWTVDTIGTSFQTVMRSIWGSSTSDIYIVGFNDENSGQMWHYDGKAWSVVKLWTAQGGNISGPFDLSAVYGFSSNNIWAVGERYYYKGEVWSNTCLIIHWNGSEWREYPVESEVSNMGGLITVGGSGPSDVWAAGINAVFHFDGVSWRKWEAPIPPQGIQFHSVVSLSRNDGYMIGYRNDVVQPGDTIAYFLYRFDGSVWSVTDSVVRTPANFTQVPKFGQELFSMKGILYSSAGGVYRMENGIWVKELDDGWAWFMGGNAVNNLYVVGGLGTIYWSGGGSRWERVTVPAISDTPLYCVWSNGAETFIVGNDGTKTYVLHGK